jgi:hypothetical protein
LCVAALKARAQNVFIALISYNNDKRAVFAWGEVSGGGCLISGGARRGRC